MTDGASALLRAKQAAASLAYDICTALELPGDPARVIDLGSVVARARVPIPPIPVPFCLVPAFSVGNVSLEQLQRALEIVGQLLQLLDRGLQERDRPEGVSQEVIEGIARIVDQRA